MTEEEWKEIEDLVGKINTGKYRCGMAAQSCLLAAYRELKERREDAKRCEKMATLFREILILKGHDVMVCQCIYCASIHSAARGK